MPEITLQVTGAEARRLQEFIAALRTPCEVVLNPQSPFGEEFESEFRSRLLAHHTFIGSPLFQESFDSAFIGACQAAGHEVELAPEGQRFWDVRVDGRKISLKSTKQKVLRAEKLHISKLCEAAWIQDCRRAADRRAHTVELFDDYCGTVDAIVQLRYFARARKYELVEIPVGLFRQVADVGRSQFVADGPTIGIPVGRDPPDFTLKLDRSDAKITIANINKQLCTVHGTWTLAAPGLSC